MMARPTDGVGQLQRGEHEEDRRDQRLVGDDQGEEQEDEEQLLARDREAGERVAGRNGQHEAEDDRQERRGGAVEEVGRQAVLVVPQLDVAVEAELVGEIGRRDRRLLHGRLQRRDDGQHQRRQHDRANGHADGADQIFRAAPPRPRRRALRPARRRSGAFVERGFRAHLGPRSRMAPPGRSLHDRADEDDHREDQRQRRAVAELQVRERIQIHPEDRRGRPVERLAGGHQEELVEGEQRPDDAEERDEQDRPAVSGNGDPPHALPVAGAVDHRRLVDLLRDRLDRGDEEEHAEADHLPHDRDDHRPERAIGVLAEPHDRLVDDAEVHQRPG